MDEEEEAAAAKKSAIATLYPFLPRENGIIRRATHTVIVLPASISSNAVKMAKRMKRYTVGKVRWRRSMTD